MKSTLPSKDASNKPLVRLLNLLLVVDSRPSWAFLVLEAVSLSTASGSEAIHKHSNVNG